MSVILVLLALLVPVGAANRLTQLKRTLPPVDDAVRRPDFFTFRANLQAAIARRDSQAVLAVVHPDIKNDFGGDDGIDAFKKIWRIAESDSPLWEELGTVLALGGTFMAEEFVAPYTFSRWPDEFNAFDHVAVVGANVRLRAEPRSDSAVVGTASFSILKLSSNSDDTPEWTAIETEDGRKAYVATRFVRSPIGFRAAFSYVGGRWQLRMFLAGD